MSACRVERETERVDQLRIRSQCAAHQVRPHPHISLSQPLLLPPDH